MKTTISNIPLTLHDPESGRCWEIPRKRVTSIYAEVTERWVANVIVPKAIVRELVVPKFLEPVPIEAGYILSLCAIFMKHAAPDWAPLAMGPASRNCALRIACRDTRDGSPAVWVDHRYSDSFLVEALAKLGFPEVHACLKVKMNQQGKGDDSITMETRDEAVALHLRETAQKMGTTDTAFPDAQAFEDYFCEGIRSYGPGTKPGTVTMVDLHKCSDNHFEALPQYRGTLHTPMGEWPVDSLYRTQNGLYEWRYEGDVTL